MSFENKSIVITGGAGFIGSFVVEELIKAGFERIIIPVSSNNYKNIQHLSDNLIIKHGNLKNYRFASQLLKGVDYVIHLASVKGNINFHSKYKADILYDNVLINLNLLKASQERGVNKIIAISSSVVNGMSCNDVANPHFGYGWSKKILEITSKAYVAQYGMNIVIVRPCNVYGPRDNFSKDKAQIIPTLIRKIVNREKPIVIWGNGHQKKKFLYVKDLANKLVELLNDDFQNITLNLCGKHEITVMQLAQTIMDLEKVSLIFKFDDSKPSVSRNESVVVDDCEAKEIAIDKTPLELGLIETIKWYKSNL